MAYRRLPGCKRGFYRKVSLWEGEDHLLLVESNYYAEQYRRFYYRDLQAITIRRNARGWVVSILFALLASLFLGLGFWQRDFVWLFGVCGGLMLLPLLIHLLRGPTCTCHLQLPQTVQELPWQRVALARKALARLRHRIAREQGTLSPEDFAAAPSPGTAPRRRPAAAGQAKAAANYLGGIHRFLFASLLVGAILTLLELRVNGMAMLWAVMLVAAASFVLVIMALVRQQGALLPGVVRALAWVALGNVGVRFLVDYIFGMYYLLAGGQPPPRLQGEMLVLLAEVRPLDYPLLASAYLAYAAVALVAGATGLIAMRGVGRGRTSSSAVPAGVEGDLP